MVELSPGPLSASLGILLLAPAEGGSDGAYRTMMTTTTASTASTASSTLRGIVDAVAADAVAMTVGYGRQAEPRRVGSPTKYRCVELQPAGRSEGPLQDRYPPMFTYLGPNPGG